MTTITDIITRWDAGEGKPYRGHLIDWDAYKADHDNIGCMCAQGQVLHLLGGWEPEQLRRPIMGKLRNTGRSDHARTRATVLLSAATRLCQSRGCTRS